MPGARVFSSAKLLGLAGALLLLAPPVLAEDADKDSASTADQFDIAFGLSATSDYISRGITQTDHNPALQGYLEGDYGNFYVGAWSSNVSFGGTTDTEVDLSVGVRPEVDKWSFDFGYVHYLYLNGNSPDFGELYGQASYAATDDFSAGTKVYWAPDYSQSGTSAVYAELNSSYSLPNNFSVSAAVGYQEFDASYGPSYLSWNAGISYKFNDWLKADLRYYDSDLSPADCATIAAAANSCDARVVASLSVDTSLSALRGGDKK